MRSRRLTLLFLAFYLVFIGGSAYYTLIFPVRLLHHAIITLLLTSWYYRRLRGDGLPKTPLNMPLFAAALVWAISAVFALDWRMAVEHLWFVFLHVSLFFMLADLLQRGRSRLVFETPFMLGALVVIITVMELASWYLGLGFVPGTEIGWITVSPIPLVLPRVSLALNISTLMAGFVAPLVPVSLAWGLTANRRDYRQVLLLLSAALAGTLLLTLSRGGLLSLSTALGLMATAWVLRSGQVPRLLLVVGVISVVVVAVFVIAISQTRDSGDDVRVDMYESAVQILADDPVTGIGPGLYGRALREARTPTLARDKLASAHNAPLNTAAETGLPGLIVSAWLVLALARSWWQNWQSEASPARKLRLEAVGAALVGVGIHSLVDVFTVTPVVLVIVLLAAYAVTGHRSVLDSVPTGSRTCAALALAVSIAYGLFFLGIDRAQLAYQRSLIASDDQLVSARQAAAYDPHLRLYDLHVAYLLGDNALASMEAGQLQDAISHYQTALALEPTWDVGWANLGALHLAAGDPLAALTAVQQAQAINPLLTYGFNIGYIGETYDLLDADTIIAYYLSGINANISQNNRLPLSEFWAGTSLRRRTLDAYLALPGLPLDWRYRIAVVHDPALATALVPVSPRTATEHWVAGQHALTVNADAETAEQHFSRAIEADRTNGDYYVSRARARVAGHLDGAPRDLDLATLLGTRFEYPNALRAQISDDADEIEKLRRTALPARYVQQEFAAVLYGGRQAIFDLAPAMRPPGPGREALAPWYALGDAALADGDPAAATDIYEAILDYAPFEQKAREALAVLTRTSRGLPD